MKTTRRATHFINKIKKISIDDICFFSIIIYSLLLIVYLMGKGDPFILSTSEDPFTFSTSCQFFFKRFLIITAPVIFVMCLFTSDRWEYLTLAIILPGIIVFGYFIGILIADGVFLYPHDAYYY